MATPIPTNDAAFTLDEVLVATRGSLSLRDGATATTAAGRGVNLGPYSGVTTDTRAVSKNAIFVALRGEHFDGHAFINDAARAGAGLALVERVIESDVAQILVPDTLTALGQLAAFHRKRWGGRVVAIAGAAGKTTTRSMTSAVLHQVYGDAVHSTSGNLNNRIGVPMVLLGLREGHTLAVVEVGTNRVGEVGQLAEVVQPDVAVLTLIALEHTEGLGDLNGVENEEGAIFSQNSSLLIVNGDDERALRQARQAQRQRRGVEVWTYGFGAGLDLQATERVTLGPWQTRLRLSRKRSPASLTHEQSDAFCETVELGLPMVGQPAAYALMAAWLAAEGIGSQALSAAQVQRALARAELQPEGRAQVVELPDGTLIIDDSYNANPPSMHAALQTAAEVCAVRGGKLHLVLGEMRELGELSPSAHAELGQRLSAMAWCTLCLIGPQMAAAVAVVEKGRAAGGLVIAAADPGPVAAELRSRLGPKDVVLIKGSRGVRTERVIADLMSTKATQP